MNTVEEKIVGEDVIEKNFLLIYLSPNRKFYTRSIKSTSIEGALAREDEVPMEEVTLVLYGGNDDEKTGKEALLAFIEKAKE